MNIAVFGDSLAQDNFGSSFSSYIKREYGGKKINLCNYACDGVGVYKLYELLSSYIDTYADEDLFIIEVGINDFNTPWQLHKVSQPIVDVFENKYMNTVEDYIMYLQQLFTTLIDHGKKVIMVGWVRPEIKEWPESQYIKSREYKDATKLLCDKLKIPFIDPEVKQDAKRVKISRWWGLWAFVNIALKRLFPFSDVFSWSSFRRRSGGRYTTDGIHLSTEGAAITGGLISDVIDGIFNADSNCGNQSPTDI